MIEKAGEGHYNPLTSKIPYARRRLVEDLKLAGLREFAKEVQDGQFRPDDDENKQFWGEGESTTPDGSGDGTDLEEGLENREDVPQGTRMHS